MPAAHWLNEFCVASAVIVNDSNKLPTFRNWDVSYRSLSLESLWTE